ncbi:MAG: cystathionine gamma-synthase [Actinomycetota bacterium]|nr:cystathionine gamma-synthase [Actinomycetota bacterium]
MTAGPVDAAGFATPSSRGFETLAVHAGQHPDSQTGAVVPVISLATTYAQEAVGRHLGYEYSRSGNPTRSTLEACLAALEGAPCGLAFSSGLAAENALLHLLGPGDHLVIPTDAYGGTFRLIDKVHRPLGIEHTAVALADLDAIEAAWRPSTRMVWVETPSNPMLNITDIAAVADIAHRRGAVVVVDNTFATPYLQRPLALGADFVVHSTTKYLGGHSDVVGGFVAAADTARGEEVAFFQNAVGGVPGPFDCFLVLRGVRTLPLRMDRHNANAAVVVDALERHPAVAQVLYPGRPDHPGHALAVRQMRGFGGMVSFVLRGGEAAALEVARSTEVFTLAESLGAVESLIEHPHKMTHASVAGSPLAVDPGLLRLSVGVESASDLVADLDYALDRVR